MFLDAAGNKRNSCFSRKPFHQQLRDPVNHNFLRSCFMGHRPVVLNLFYISYPFIKQDYRIYPQAQYTHWCSLIENTKLTNFYSLEWFITFTFVAIYGSANSPPWKMKFTPRGKFTPRLRTTVIDGNVFVSTEKKLVISVRMSENIGQ